MPRLLKRIDALAAERLPKTLYFMMQDWFRPNSRNNLVRGGRRVEAVDSGYRVQWENETEFYFAHPQRYVRYMRRGGLDHIFGRMLQKYQDGPVIVEKGDIVVDVGANVGEFACAVSPLANRVLALEPDPNVLPSLGRNADRYGNITVIPVAAGASDDVLEFYIQSATADSSLIQPENWSEKISVPTKKLSLVMDENRLTRIDFLKVEAEGYEPEVLKGAEEALSTTRKVAVDCSPERRGQTTFEECEEILSSFGFSTWRGSAEYEVLYGLRKASGSR